MIDELRDKIERFKVKAEDFLENNIKAFVVDINDTYYFCEIIVVGEVWLLVQNFKGTRTGETEKIYWADVVKLKEYKEREVM